MKCLNVVSREIKLVLLPIALLLSAILLKFAESVTFVDRSPVALDLPDKVESWELVQVAFCQNELCMHEAEGEAAASSTCELCGHELDMLPISEKQLLPQDTIIRHAIYRKSAESSFQVTVVVSGQSRSSIHKPEWCLKGQGFKINNTIHTSLNKSSGSKGVEIALLDLTFANNAASLENTSSNARLAYWFVGHTASTSHQYMRMLLMAQERIFKGEANRWAYISVLWSTTPNAPPIDPSAESFLLSLDSILSKSGISISD